jgi:hypothetical protein
MSTAERRVGQVSCLPLLFRLARVHDLAFALDVLLVALGRRQRQLAGEQIVPGVAVGDLHDLAALAQVIHVLSENDFHGLNPPCTG